MRLIFLAGVLALSMAGATAMAAPPAVQGMLTIKIEKVSPRGGDLRVAVYTEQAWADDNADPATGTVVTAKPGETVVTLGPLKPGFYGVKLFQDFNRNGHFDLNWVGWPLEKYGFSNDAIPTIGEPSFDAAKFEIRPGANTIVIHLR